MIVKRTVTNVSTENASKLLRPVCAFQTLVCCITALGTLSRPSIAADPPKGPLPVAVAGDPIVVKHEAIKLVDNQKYKVNLALEAQKRITLTAPTSGVVKSIAVKPGEKCAVQMEAVRMENSIRKLQLDRAEAVLKAATEDQKTKAKLKQSGSLDASVLLAADAVLATAEIDYSIAKALLEQTSIKVPFACEVQRILVSEGQYVREGDPLVILGDPTILVVEIPAERADAEIGKPYKLKVESSEVEGKIDAVMPLPAQFTPLRDLFDSVVSVNVVLENPGGKLKVGQTVFPALIPRQPVTEVPASAIANLPDGQRKVQVLRLNNVRDIPVVLMGGVGPSRLYVSGPFAVGDEVIYETSHQLGDGFVLNPSTGPAKPGSPGSTTGTTPGGTNAGDGRPTTNKGVGF